MSVSNLKRIPGRTLLAAAGLFIGVASLALLLSITLAFQGALVGTALGAVISVQVRGVDYLGVGLALFLGAFSVADVLFLNLRERAPELVTLRAAGWRDVHLIRLVAGEGLGIGLLGSIVGGTVGLALSAIVGGSPARIILAGVLAALAGTGVALGASLVPASLISRMTPPTVLAEE
jgi:ABC-type antimicrobial peptide transport system permease subunit